MVLPPAFWLVNEIAERRLGARNGSAAVPAWPAVMTALVLSAVLMTFRTAGVSRSSSGSRFKRFRRCARGRETEYPVRSFHRRRSQERMGVPQRVRRFATLLRSVALRRFCEA